MSSAIKNNKAVGYFENLAKGTQTIVKDMLMEAANDRNGPEGYRSSSECIESIECHSRDGFIAWDHNRGGLMYRNFTDLMDYWGGGYSVAHSKAEIEIQRQIDYSLECLSADTHGKFEELLTRHGVSKENTTYVHVQNLLDSGLEELRPVLRHIEDKEGDYLSGDENSIMHEFRFMYHGVENGLHSASVSAAVNTEGPYHRSGISWAPNVFCEGAKEVEIVWKNQAELKRKLAKALKQVSKAIF